MDNIPPVLHNTRKPRNLLFLHGGHHPKCTAHVDKVFTYHTLQLMTYGSVDLSYGNQTYQMKNAWIWPASPGPRVRFNSTKPSVAWNHRYIAFEGALADDWLAEGLMPSLPFPVPTRQELNTLVHLFDSLLNQFTRADKWGYRRSVNLLERLLIETMASSTQPEDHTPPWLHKILRSLEICTQEPAYGQLAEEAGMSLSTLRKRFRILTGTPPHAYHLNAKIAKARSMLGDTDLTIKQIANKLNFRDVHYFTRLFTQIVGVPPARYRQTRQS